jgi:copper(I)-binding protein
MCNRITCIGLAFGLGLLAGCGEPPPEQGRIEVRDAWVRAVTSEGEGTGNTAAYMRIVNTSGSADQLLAVRSDIARAAEVHRTTVDDSGLATMGPAGTVEIPAGDSVSLEPGGLHVMLMGLRHTLEEGKSVGLTLVLESAGELPVVAAVRRY